jgi:hypothetical protein
MIIFINNNALAVLLINSFDAFSSSFGVLEMIGQTILRVNRAAKDF